MVEDEVLDMENITVEISDLPELLVNNSAGQEVPNNNNDLFQRGVLAQSQSTQGNGVDILQGGIQQSEEGNQPHLPSSGLSTMSSSSSSVSSTFLAPIIPVITLAMDPYMAKKYYELRGNNKKVLGAMVTGIVDPEGHTISFECEPYLSYDNKKEFSVSNIFLHKEITRRWKQNPTGYKVPRPSGWTRLKTIQWLKENPIIFPNDIEFIVSEEKLFRTTITGANVQKANETSSGGRIWNSDSILRLIHCEEDDTIMEALAQKHAADDR